jgi:hypothetical protein
MDADFERIVGQLRYWLECRGLPTEGATVEVILPTAAAARIAERRLEAEIDPRYRFASREPVPTGVAATIHGVHIRFKP